MAQSLVVVLLVFYIAKCSSQNDEQYLYSKGEVPTYFRLNQSYPNRREADVCRPIRLRIDRDSALFRTELVVADTLHATFASADARVMTSRMSSRLGALASLYARLTRSRLNVLKVWTPYPDPGVTDLLSLHYEGRSALVSVGSFNASELLHLAIQAGFDWVSYVSTTYVKLSVTPDACRTNLDLVFMLDQSSSVGRTNHARALRFITSVVGYFDIAPNATRVGLVTFSTSADVAISLDRYRDQQSLQRALASVSYRGGYTYTAGALYLARLMLDPTNAYGARPLSVGVPRVAVLITDGRSNLAPVAGAADALRSSGVQVFCVGVGEVELSELKTIASYPAPRHVFLLESFSSVGDLVQLLSFSTCDAPAMMGPGTNTTSTVKQDDFRYFQSLCTAFSLVVIVEQVDIVGTCSLYASSSVQNPGPLSRGGVVVANENSSLVRRSVMVTFNNHTPSSSVPRTIFIAVRGVKASNVFSVVYWDMAFLHEVYTLRAPVGVNQFILLNLTAQLRPTNASFVYSISEGNNGGYFLLTPTTGILSVSSRLPSKTNATYVLTVIAQNTLYVCHRARVVITVVTYSPSLLVVPLSPVSLPENVAVGTAVALVRASGAGDSYLFSIAAGNVGGAFAVGPANGRVTVASQLNYEVVTSYALTIQVQSVSFASIRNSTTLVVRVLDVEEPPFFIAPCASAPPTQGGCTFQVYEDVPLGTLVGTLRANVSDLLPCPGCGNLTYSVDAPSPVPFVINQLGEVRIAGPLDRERVPSYTFNVSVSERGRPLLTSRALVHVVVSDVNNNPPILISPSSITVPENTPPGTVVTRLVGMDADSGINAEIRFAINSPPAVPFQLNPLMGDLVLVSVLDRETTPFYVFNVTLSNPTPGPITVVTFTVLVGDVNDNAPRFSSSLYTAGVKEHSPLNSLVIVVNATDNDAGSNARITYSITRGNINNSFFINQVTGAISVSNDISRDASSSYTLVVIATDGGVPPLYGTTTVQITVVDINDHAPVFLQSSYYAVLSVNTVAPSKLLTVSAVDQDEPNSPNSIIDYLIVGGNEGGLFAINSSTGAFSLAMNLTAATIQPGYLITVAARDRGFPPLNSTATVNVQVVGAPPAVADVPLGANVEYNLTISELTPVGALVAAVAPLNSSGQVQPLTFSFVGGSNSSDFDVNVTTGYVTVAKRLDVGRQTLYVLTIRGATSGNTSVSVAVLRISVLAANRQPPMFTSSGPFAVTEDQPIGTLVGVVMATVPEPGALGAITYALVVGRASFLFSLDPSSGALTTREVLSTRDLAMAGLFLPPASNATLLVRAQDGGAPPLVTVAQVVVHLRAAANRPPVFSMASYRGTVLEGQPAGTVVLKVHASDPDLGSNGLVVYSLATQGSVPFQVDPVTGVVNTTAVLDLEGNVTYVITITASDGGSPPLSANATVTITVLDIDDSPPVFSQSAYQFIILETFPPGEPIDVVTATVADGNTGAGAALVYSIRSQDPTLPFSVGGNNGVIFLNQDAVLNANVRQSYNFTVVATDLEPPGLSASATVTITLIKVNKTPPTFLGPCNADVLENAPVGTVVTVCTAMDFDAATNTTLNDVTYLIADGNVGNAFRFVPSDRLGTIVTQVPLNRTLVQSYSLTIGASNPFAFRSLMEVTITVVSAVDINNPPVFVDPPSTVNITDASIANHTTMVATITASDRDTGANGQLNYSIAGSVQLGTQTLLTIKVMDGGSPPLSATVNVSVQFQSPCSIQAYSIDGSSGTITAGLLCRVGLVPMETNVTVGGNATLYCSALGNVPLTYQFAHNDSFVTLPSTQARLGLREVGFVDGGTYSCKVTTQVGSLQSRAGVVNIQVPPSILVAPRDQALELGRTAQFTCQATGIPSPVVTWERIIGGGALVGVVPSLRVSLLGPFLVITEVQAGDQGVYACVASNSAGVATASGTLTIFGVSDAVMASIVNFSKPNSNKTCNEFNTSDFQNAVATITGFSTAVSVVAGDALCSPSACSPSPCGNGGSCQLDMAQAPGGYHCTCASGYTGANCEQDIDECRADPCLNNGTCTNTAGSFACTCPSNFTGFWCQYKAMCLSPRGTLCPPPTTCVETTTNVGGYVCENLTSDTHLTISAPTLSGAQLEEVEYILMEAQPISTGRRKRSDPNGTQFDPTLCEARFIPFESYYILVWACLPGATPPGNEALQMVCGYFSHIRGISWCRLPGNVTIFQSAPAPPQANLNVTFILLDPTTGSPLSSTMALQVLALSGAQARLGAYGYQVTGFSEAAAAAADGVHISTSSSTWPVAVPASVATILLLLAVICVVILILVLAKRRHTRRKIKLSRNAHWLASTSSLQYDSGSLQNCTYCLMPAEKEAAYMFHPQQQQQQQQQSFTEDPFDDPVYASGYSAGQRSSPQPPVTSRTSSFANKRTESSTDLLEPAGASEISLRGMVQPNEMGRRCMPPPPPPPPKPARPQRY